MTKQELKHYLHIHGEYENRRLNKMTSMELLDAWCNYNCLVGGWAYNIVEAVEGAFEIKIKK